MSRNLNTYMLGINMGQGGNQIGIVISVFKVMTVSYYNFKIQILELDLFGIIIYHYFIKHSLC